MLRRSAPGPLAGSGVRSFGRRAVLAAALALALAAPATAQIPRRFVSTGAAARDTAVAPPGEGLGFGLTARGLADAVDAVGDALGEPGWYPLAVRVAENLAGPRHPLVGYLRIRWARSLLAQGDRAGALREAIAGEGVLREHLRTGLLELSEEQARRIARFRESALDLVVTLAVEDPRPQARRAAWDAYLRSRALVLDEMAERQRTVVASGDSLLGALAGALAEARAQIAALSLATPAEDGSTRARLDGALRRRDSLERAIGARSTAWRRRLQQRDVGLDAVIRALAPGEAVVGYVDYVPQRAASPARRSAYGRALAPVAPRPHVMAFVLGPAHVEPLALDLGETAAVNDAIARWRDAVAASGAGGDSAQAATARARDAGAALRRLVWDPIASHVAGATRLHIVPDGGLQMVPFGTLPAEGADAPYLVEQLPPTLYHGTERDLAGGGPAPGAHGGLLAVGGVDFGGAPGGADDALTRSGGVDAEPCRSGGAMRFGRLPATAQEVQEIADLVASAPATSPARGAPPRLLLGAEARESAVRAACPRAGLVHLATHGFRVGSDCRTGWYEGAWADRADALAPPPAGLRSPLAMIGLALAGANMPGPVSSDDGLLTAEEIASIDLSHADWVVLSACETGLGQADPGEGLIGLRRALDAAGARVVVTGMWKVDDRATRAFMAALYRARYVDGLPPGDAMRQASLARLRLLRERGADTSPILWGAFVLNASGTR